MRLRGVLVEHGSAPYQFDEDNRSSYYVKLKNIDGEQEIVWGVDLERALQETDIPLGEQVSLEFQGRQPVMIERPILNDKNEKIGTEEVEVYRNEWKVEAVHSSGNLEDIPLDGRGSQSVQPGQRPRTEAGPNLGVGALLGAAAFLMTAPFRKLSQTLQNHQASKDFADKLQKYRTNEAFRANSAVLGSMVEGEDLMESISKSPIVERYVSDLEKAADDESRNAVRSMFKEASASNEELCQDIERLFAVIAEVQNQMPEVLEKNRAAGLDQEVHSAEFAEFFETLRSSGAVDLLESKEGNSLQVEISEALEKLKEFLMKLFKVISGGKDMQGGMGEAISPS